MSAPGAGLVAYLPAAPSVVVPAHGVGNRADLPLPFEPSQAGQEILADVEVDAEVLAGVAGLDAQGYLITVDAFAVGQDREALLPYASYAKVDLLNADLGGVRRPRDAASRQLRRSRRLNPHAPITTPPTASTTDATIPTGSHRPSIGWP